MHCCVKIWYSFSKSSEGAHIFLDSRNSEQAIILSGLIDATECFILVAPLQAGKTTLLRQVAAGLKNQYSDTANPDRTIVELTVSDSEEEHSEIFRTITDLPQETILLIDSVRKTSPTVLQKILTELIASRKQFVMCMEETLPERHRDTLPPHIHQLSLSPLTGEEAEEVVQSISGSIFIDANTREHLFHITGGNLGLLVTMTRAIVATIRQDKATDVHWDDAMLASLPPAKKYVEQQLESLSRQDLSVLSHIAIAKTVPASFVAELYLSLTEGEESTQIGGLAQSAELNDARSSALVGQEPHNLFSFLESTSEPNGMEWIHIADPMLMLVLSEALTGEQKRQHFAVLSQLGQTFLHNQRSITVRNKTIVWTHQAGQVVPWSWLEPILASRELTDSYREDVVICSAIILHPTASNRERALGYILRAQRLRFLHSAAAAYADLQYALDEFRKHPVQEDAELIVEIAFISSDIEQYSFDQILDSSSRIEQAEYLLTQIGDPKALRLLQVGKAVRTSYAGKFLEGSQLIEDCVKTFQTADVLPLASAKMLIQTQQGRYEDASRFGNRALFLSLLHGNKTVRQTGEIGAALFYTHLMSGDLGGAIKLQNRAKLMRREREFYGQYDRALVEFGAGQLGLHQGLWQEATSFLKNAVVRFRLQDPSGFLALGLSAYALALAANNDPVQAFATIEELQNVPYRSSRIVEGNIRIYLVQALMRLGASTAQQEAEDLIGWAKERQLQLIELQARHMLMQITKRFVISELAHLSALEQKIDAPLAEHIVHHAEEMVSQKATAAFGPAARMLARHGYWIPQPISLPELTGREQEIAIMVGLGFTSRAIAHKFSISKRTVDSHLSRIFMKLDLTNRDELADALERVTQ